MFIDNMEAQIHHLEQEAYCAVLRAFKAQSDAITWEKEGLITELRKELGVSDDEHRELLARVNSDDIIKRIREWRQGGGGHQASRFSGSQPVIDIVSSPTVSGSRKKQKTSQLGQPFPRSSSIKSVQYPSAISAGNRYPAPNLVPSGSAVLNTQIEGRHDPLIGKRVWTRWPDDNIFYEAVISDYNPADGRHALVYDMHTPQEALEWVNLKEIPPEDIRWEGEEPVIPHQYGGGDGRGIRKPPSLGGFVPTPRRARVLSKDQSSRDFPPAQNGFNNKVSDEIELLNTQALVKEVEMIFNASRLDPIELDKAKKMLKKHEQALIEAIARLAEESDGESDGERHIHLEAMDH